jgi:hypothetical protein
VTVVCVNQGNAFTIFTAIDLRSDLSQNTDPRFVFAAGQNAAFAVTSMMPENLDAGRQDGRILIRGISDSSTSPLRNLVTYTATGYVRVANAWATPSELSIIAADDLGLFRLAVAVQGADPDPSAMTRSDLFTPVDCQSPAGRLRDVHASNDGGVRYVMTCESGATLSLWRGVGATGAQIGTGGPGIELVARNYISHGGQDLILCGGDGPAPRATYRLGMTTAELAVTHDMALSSAAGDFSMFEFTQFPGGTGSFVLGAKMKDPNGATVLPVEISAGSVLASEYHTLTAVPPSQLRTVATYTSATNLLFPADTVLLGNPPAMRAIVAELDILAKHHVYVEPFAGNGVKLGEPFEVYTPGDTAIVVDNVAIERVGFGMVVGWTENASIVRGRGVVCP